MGSFLVGIFWFLMGKLFGIYRKNKTEEELYEAKKENIELKAEAAGQQVEREIEKENAEREAEWAEAERANDTRRKYEILKRDFDNGDSD